MTTETAPSRSCSDLAPKMSQQSAGNGGASPLQLAALSAAAAALGLAAGAAAVYWMIRYDAEAEEGRSRSGSRESKHSESRSNLQQERRKGKHRCESGSRGGSVVAAIPLFDSVQVTVLLLRLCRCVPQCAASNA